MSADDIIFLGERAMWVTLLVSAPMLLSGMIIGLAIGIFQSVTQIQEMTLTFVPKILVVMLVFIITLPWMADILVQYIRDLILGFHTLVK